MGQWLYLGTSRDRAKCIIMQGTSTLEIPRAIGILAWMCRGLDAVWKADSSVTRCRRHSFGRQPRILYFVLRVVESRGSKEPRTRCIFAFYIHRKVGNHLQSCRYDGNPKRLLRGSCNELDEKWCQSSGQKGKIRKRIEIYLGNRINRTWEAVRDGRWLTKTGQLKHLCPRSHWLGNYHSSHMN